jgi:hypothetical protein
MLVLLRRTFQKSTKSKQVQHALLGETRLPVMRFAPFTVISVYSAQAARKPHVIKNFVALVNVELPL